MKLKYHLKPGILAVAMLFIYFTAAGADRYSVASGNWSSTSTWSETRGGTPGASVPGAADDVFIDNAHEVSVDYEAECNNITVGFGTGGTLNIGRRTTQPRSQSLFVHGDLIVNPGAAIVPRRNREVHSMVWAGNVTNHGSMIFTSDATNDPVCNITITSTGNVNIGGSVPVWFNDLAISTGSTVTLVSGGHILNKVLLNNGILNSGGNLTIRSTSISTALVDGASTGSFSGSIIVERYIPVAFGYKYFSSPFKDALVGGFADDIDLTAAFPTLFRYYEGSLFSGWSPYTSSAYILNPLEGYAANLGSSSLPRTVELYGEVNHGPLEITLYNHNNTSTRGFSLVGNPYPSPINWDAAGWTKTNVDNAIYYFRASSTDQYGGAYSSYVNGVSSDGVANNIIPSMQGFFVHVRDGSYPVTATLGVINSVRINDHTHVFLKSSSAVNSPLLRISAAFTGDTASADPTVIYFDEEATAGFDSNQDALKILNTDWMMVNLFSISSDGRDLSINSLPAGTDTLTIIPLTILTYADGEVVFSLKDKLNIPVGSKVFLIDNKTTVRTDLEGGTYSATLPAGEYKDRFSLMLRGELLAGIPETENEEHIFSAFSAGDLLNVSVKEVFSNKGRVEIFNVSGTLYGSYPVTCPGDYMFETNLPAGIYLVRYRSGNIFATEKILFRK